MRKNGKLIACFIAAVVTFGIASVPAQASLFNSEVAGNYETVEIRTAADAARSSIPSGAYRVNLNVNGRNVLSGRVFNLGGVTYVPMFSFADWLGVFSKSYNSSTKTARISGTKLEISATVGQYYISANERYFYTGGAVMLYGGEVFVTISPLVKALNSYLRWSSSNSTFYVSSGDTRLLKSGSQFYNSDEVYWLARIISAEAQGESIKGKIAVGNVVLNRVRSYSYPNTIYGVIFDKRYGIQFSPVANGTIYNTPTAESVIAAKICLEGYSLSSEIIYFLNPSISSSSWIIKNRPYAFTIGKHAFYE